MRIRTASNRHWEFIVDELLPSLNDRIAKRNGAQYYFTVQETSLDWDVAFSVIKDRSGNKIKEKYISAWVQPSLVGPEDDMINNLGVKLTWDSDSPKQNAFSAEEVNRLFAAVDRVIGLPIKQSTVAFKVADDLMLLQQLVDSNILPNGKSKLIEQNSVQQTIDNLLYNPETAVWGFTLDCVVKLLGTDSVSITEIYDLLSRFERTTNKAIMLIETSKANYRNALSEIESLYEGILAQYGIETEERDRLQLIFSHQSSGVIVQSLKSAIKNIQDVKNRENSLEIHSEKIFN